MRVVRVITGSLFKRAQIALATNMFEWCKSAGLVHLKDYDYIVYSVHNYEYQTGPGSDSGEIRFRFFNEHEISGDDFISVWGGQ